MNGTQHTQRSPGGRSGRRRPRRGGPRQPPPLPLTEEGVPAAAPDGPRPSPTVFVSDDSLERFPWLPRRVIAGSVWRGPAHERVRVDDRGQAVPWRTRRAS